jgi:hypothetical protein
MKTVIRALALGAAIAATAPASAAMIDSVQIKSIAGDYLQIAELQLFSGGKNVATSGIATATSTYVNGPAVPSNANDGSTVGTYPSIYHGNASNGSDIFTLTLKMLTDVNTISIFGRTDACCTFRDVYSYTLFNGTKAVKTGTLDASATSFASSAVPEPATWGLMILGFAGIGAAMRRRKAQTVRVTYA